MSRKIAQSSVDPTLPKTPVTIDGKTYDLCLDLGALAEAESALIAEGHHGVNLLMALPAQTLSSTRIIFAAALRTFHPEIAFEDAKKLLTLGALYDIALKIQEAWQAATPEPEKTPSDPSQPGDE
jgi:hypothetical protein